MNRIIQKKDENRDKKPMNVRISKQSVSSVTNTAK